jgi:hypothetical protein
MSYRLGIEYKYRRVFWDKQNKSTFLLKFSLFCELPQKAKFVLFQDLLVNHIKKEFIIKCKALLYIVSRVLHVHLGLV